MGHRTDCILIPIEAFQECFRGLRRAGHHKDVFQLRKIDGKIVRRAFHTSHNRLCLPEVGLALCLARAPAARTSPGGTEWRSILRTVTRASPNSCEERKKLTNQTGRPVGNTEFPYGGPTRADHLRRLSAL
jgi:hypothetical protein